MGSNEPRKEPILAQNRKSASGIIDDAKNTFNTNTAKIAANHSANHPAHSDAPMVENVNDWMENFNKGFEKKNQETSFIFARV